MILNAIAEKLKRQSKDDFKGRYFEAADRAGVAWYLRYPLSYRNIEEMFRERGFEPAEVADLPMQKQTLYNWQRRSKVFIKPL